jgi:RNA recognition motif-containing protein
MACICILTLRPPSTLRLYNTILVDFITYLMDDHRPADVPNADALTVDQNDEHLDRAKVQRQKQSIAAQPQPQPHQPVLNTPYSSNTVYICGMPMRYCTETVIEKMMSPYGTIARCTVHTQQSHKLFAFCEYTDASSAKEAIRVLNGRKLGGRSLLLRPAYKENGSSSSSAVIRSTTTSSISNLDHNPKRQRQQLDTKIEAIKRKLAKCSSGSDINR